MVIPRKKNNKPPLRKFRSSRKSYLRKERASVRKQKKQLRRIKRSRRISLFKRYLNRIKSQFLVSLRNPNKLKQKSNKDRLLRKQIRSDIKESYSQSFRKFPAHFLASLTRPFWVSKERLNYKLTFLRNSYKPIKHEIRIEKKRVLLIKVFFNSAITFVMAFWIMYFLSQIISILIAQQYSIPSILYSYVTMWPLSNASPLYSRWNLILIFGMGPAACFLFALSAYYLFARIKGKVYLLRILLLWLIFHGINMSFGALISGITTRTGMAYVSSWIFYNHTVQKQDVVIVLVAIISLIFFGQAGAKRFLSVSPSKDMVRPSVRILYLSFQVFLPWLVGCLIIMLTNLPHAPIAYLGLFGVSSLMIFPMFINYNSPSNQNVRFISLDADLKINKVYIFIFFAAIIVVRFFIYPGIHFN